MEEIQGGLDRRVSDGGTKQAKETPSLEHRYLVLISAFMTFGLSLGFVFTFGTFLLDILEKFGQSRAYSAIIQAVMIGITMCAGVPNGLIINHLGPRKCGMLGGVLLSVGTAVSYFAFSVLYLIISFGVVAGWGISLLFLSSTVATGQHFDGPRKLLALSVVNGSSGITMVVFPYVMSFLVSQYGLHWAFLILSGLLMNTIPAAALWESRVTGRDVINTHNATRPGYEQASIHSNRTEAMSTIRESWKSYIMNFKSLLKNSPFVLFNLSVIFSLPAINSFAYLFFDIFQSKGFSLAKSLQLFLAYTIFGAVGRFAPGILKQIPRLGALWILTSFLILGETGYIGVTFSNNFSAVMVFCALIGSALGALIGSFSVVTATETGPRNFHIGFSFLITSVGIFNSLAGPLGGLIYDRTQTYDFVLYTSSVGVFCGILFSIAGSIVKCKQRKERIKADSVFTTIHL